MESLNSLALFALFGVGLIQGMIGAGGGVLCLPIMIHVLHNSMPQAIVNSLVILTPLAWIRTFLYKNFLSWPVLLPILIPSLLATSLSMVFLIPNLPDHIGHCSLFQILNALQKFLLFLSGLFLLISSPTLKSGPPSFIRMFFISILSGSLTALIGSGAGVLLLPSLILFAKIPSYQASAITMCVIAIGSSVTLALAPLGPSLPLSGFGAAIFGLACGVAISKKISATLLSKIMGVFLISLSIFIK